MIKSFQCADTARLFRGERVARFANITIVATRKLQQLDSAATLDALKSPHGNRLEKLSGNRRGEYSVRINDHWRLCFVWKSEGAFDVEIVDYH